MQSFFALRHRNVLPLNRKWLPQYEYAMVLVKLLSRDAD
jgi:hypothetical protein